MPETDIKNFNYQEFSTNLVSQAQQVLPPDLSEEDKHFILDIILRFCNMAGSALVKEENSPLNQQEASLVTQFIGEWIFHKSVDMSRAHLDNKIKEMVLQKIAFTVYEIAKKSIEKKFPQDQIILLVETHVKRSFEKAMAELKEKGVLDEGAVNNALNQSNIDQMAQEVIAQEEEKVKAKEEELRKKEEELFTMADAKMIKLASLAVLIKNFPQEKIKSIVQKFNNPERDILLKYLELPDLEEKLDSRATMKCFEEIKNVLPEVVVISYDKAYNKMCKIIKKSPKDTILNIIKDERPIVRDFVLSCYEKRRKKIPAHIADTITKYLEEKIS